MKNENPNKKKWKIQMKLKSKWKSSLRNSTWTPKIPTDKVPEIEQSTQKCHEIHSKKKRYHEWKQVEITVVEINLQGHEILIVSEYF